MKNICKLEGTLSSYKDFIKKPATVNRANVPKEEQELVKLSSLNLAQHLIQEPNIRTITPNVVVQLQRILGNLATSRILEHHSMIQRGSKHGKGEKQDKKERKNKKDNEKNEMLQDNEEKNSDSEKSIKFNFEEYAEGKSDGYDHNQIQVLLVEYIRDTQADIQVQKMAAYINKIIQLITAKDFHSAYKILTNGGLLNAVGYSLNFDEEGPDLSNESSLEGALRTSNAFMHSPMYHTIKISNIYLGDVHFLNHPKCDQIAPLVLTTMLEEWIHAFQNLSNSVLGNCVEDFKEFCRENEDEFTSNNWSLNELDIFVIYQTLGWNGLLDAFADRYKERDSYKKYVAGDNADSH